MNMGKALTYLISAQFQALTLIVAAYYAGEWLNEQYPVSGFNWYIGTFIIAVIAIGQTFYIVLKRTFRMQASEASHKEKK